MKRYQKKANKHRKLKISEAKKGHKAASAYHGKVSSEILSKKRNLTSKEKKSIYKNVSPQKPKENVSGGYYKPLSKQEAEIAKKANVSNDEYRYEQACSWAIMMGEPLPDRNKFMSDLAKKREMARRARQ